MELELINSIKNILTIIQVKIEKDAYDDLLLELNKLENLFLRLQKENISDVKLLKSLNKEYERLIFAIQQEKNKILKDIEKVSLEKKTINSYFKKFKNSEGSFLDQKR